MNTKSHVGSKKTSSSFTQVLYFPNTPRLIILICNDCLTCQLRKLFSNQKQIKEKQVFNGQSLSFNHRRSFDTKGPISPFSERSSYIMVIVAEITHYVALNLAPQCNVYYAYTTVYEHWIAKIGLPENFAIENGTELINNEIVSHFTRFDIRPLRFEIILESIEPFYTSKF